MKMPTQQTKGTGSLIPFHQHNNLDLLQLLTDTNGLLYYNGKPVTPPVKNDKNNALQVTSNNELFVDGTYFLSKEQYEVLSKFDYAAYLLTFNGREVALKADDSSVKSVINQVWSNIDNDVNYSWLKLSAGGASS